MEFEPYIVYVKTDDANRITAIQSSAFLTDAEGWTEIDRGFGPQFMHAQGNYLTGPVYDEHGVPRYTLKDGAPEERTQEEMDADLIQQEKKPSEEERIAALEEQIDMLLSGVTDDA